MNSSLKLPVHVEVSLKVDCSVPTKEIVSAVVDRLGSSCPFFKDGPVLLNPDDPLLHHIESVVVCDIGTGKSVSFWQAELCVHVLRLSDSVPEKDFLEGEEDLPACEQWELPNRNLNGLWESIVADDNIKKRLLGYCSTSMMFAGANVDSNIISWNRMVLLHGPPGE